MSESRAICTFEIPETARNANRFTADHFEIVAALAYRIVSKETLSESFVLQPEQLAPD